ncbi:kinase-like domain-containing protein [Lipomyces japonicus]|uniref:kinase-like domain-containing protein n=1 Tax=Lipomyces japonicus TaxID=56871 RepID=UPI0034CEAD45
MEDSATQPQATQLSFLPDESKLSNDSDVVCTLYCLTGQVADEQIKLRLQDTIGKNRVEWKFGRHPNCDFQLGDHKRVSNNHFKIWANVSSDNQGPPTVLIEDTSTNGTYLNQAKLVKNRSSLLTHGDEIGIGMGVPEDEIRFIVRIPTLSINKSKREESLLDKGIYGRIDMRGMVGKGAFATVRRGVDRKTGEVVAVKVIPRSRIMKGLGVKREVEILMKLDHPNVVRLKDYDDDAINIYLVMEYVSGGDLMDYVTNNGPMSDKMARIVLKQVLQAVAHVHHLGISHRDIKPDNILLVQEDPVQVKVTDFGLAKISESGTFLKTFCGTLAYLAPEVIKARDSSVHKTHLSHYSNKVDMWSIGCLAYVLLTGYLPFNGHTQEQLCHQIVNGHYAPQPLDDANVTADARAFIAALLQVDPNMRPSATTAQLLTWVHGGGIPLLSHPQIDRDVPLLTKSSVYFEEQKQQKEHEKSQELELVSESESESDPERDDEDQEGHSSDIDSSALRDKTAHLRISQSSMVLPKTSMVDVNDEVHDKFLADGVRDVENDSYIPMALVDDLFPNNWLMLQTESYSLPYKDIIIDSKDKIWIGRDAKCDARLEDPRISKIHCLISRKEVNDGKSSLYVHDFSSNGCFVNDVKIGKWHKTQLQDGDVVKLFVDGSTTLAFKVRLQSSEIFTVPHRPDQVPVITSTAIQKSNELQDQIKQDLIDFSKPLPKNKRTRVYEDVALSEAPARKKALA